MDQSIKTNQSLRVGIIGGSITGCAAAIEFSRGGHQVAVFERSPEGLTERGAGIGTPISMLRTLIERNLLDKDFPHFELSAMPFLGRSSEDDRLGHAAWTMPVSIALLKWADLFNNLRSRVPDELYHHGHEVTEVKMRPDDTAELHLADGSVQQFDLVIFADGYRSFGRKMLFPETRLRYRGYVLWRGVLDEKHLTDSTPLDTSIPRISYKGLNGHLVIYFVPGEGGTTAKGQRLVNWAAYIPVTPEELPDFLLDRDGRQRTGSIPPGGMRMEEETRLKDLMQAHLPGFYADIISATLDTFAQPIFSIDMPADFKDRICLMGDAGTVAPPFTGSGVFKGVHNAIDLLDVLEEARDIDSALLAWDAAQTKTGHHLAVLGDQMEEAWIWAAPDFSKMDARTTEAWWKKSVTFPEDFSYSAED